MLQCSLGLTGHNPQGGTAREACVSLLPKLLHQLKIFFVLKEKKIKIVKANLN